MIREACRNDQVLKHCRGSRYGSLSVMEDAMRDIQETGHEQRPARMVGLFSLDSAQSSKDAGRGYRRRLLRQRGE